MAPWCVPNPKTIGNGTVCSSSLVWAHAWHAITAYLEGRSTLNVAYR